MRWAVEVQRTELERRNLEDLLRGLGFTLVDGGEHLAFTSPEIDKCSSSAEVFEIGKKVRNAFGGPAQVDPQFTIGSIEDHSCVPPRRHALLEVQSCVHTVTSVFPATLTVTPPAHLSPAQLDAWHRDRAEQEYQAKLVEQRLRLEPSFLEPRAAKVLEYLAATNPGADVLYKVYELIEGPPKGRKALHAQFGVSASEFDRFRDAVHNQAVSGDWARHAFPEEPRTSNPMSKGEAEQFVRSLAERWLASLRKSPPP